MHFETVQAIYWSLASALVLLFVFRVLRYFTGR